MSMRPGTPLALILLSAISLAQLLRVLFGWPVTVAEAVIPVWVSGIACVVAGLAAFLLWQGSRRP